MTTKPPPLPSLAPSGPREVLDVADRKLDAAQRNFDEARASLASLRRRLVTPDELPPWYLTARGELGVREIPGKQHADRVLEYLATCSKLVGGNLGGWGAGRDETPWCSAFVGWSTLQVGLESTRSAAARSWLNWGKELDDPRIGAVVVLTRGEGGHVGFYVKRTASKVVLLGGNQGNQVSIAPYDRSRIIGIRWPTAREGWHG